MKNPDQSFFAEIDHPDGLIAVTADDYEHMVSGHFSDKTPGSKFKEPIEAILEEVRLQLPESLEYSDSDDIHIEIECDRIIGTTGIGRRIDLYNAGIIDGENFRLLDEAEPVIYARNLLSSPEEKQAFVKKFNERLSTNCQLTIRNNTICVVVESELSETNSFVAILNPSQHEAAAHQLVTMFPGPDMPRLPGDEYFDDRSEINKGQPRVKRRGLLAQQLVASQKWSQFAFLRQPSE